MVREREEALRKVQGLEAQVRELQEQVSLLRLGRGSIPAEREEGTGDREEEEVEEECVECESEEDV